LFHSWTTQSSKFETYSPSVEQRDFATQDKFKVHYTKTVYIPGGETAVTGTEEGDILVWDQSVLVSGIGDNNQKRLIKIVSLTNGFAINVLMTVDDQYLVCGD